MAAKKPKKFTVGQTVIVTGPRNSKTPVEAVVTKVGTKLVTVGEGVTARQFAIAGGKSVMNFDNGSIYTAEEWAEKPLRDAALSTIRNGIYSYRMDNVPTSTLREIAAILNADD